MVAPLIQPDTDREEILRQNTYTRSRLRSNPLTAALVAPFDVFHETWLDAQANEITLEIGMHDAEAATFQCDDDLDDLTDELSARLLILTDGDRTLPVFKLFFGSQRPSDFKRPILGKQLAAMHKWTASLSLATDPNLQAIGTKLAPLLEAADTAVANLSAAESALDAFHGVGGGKALIDQFNAIRQAAYGTLAQMPHDPKTPGLPANFADRFFLHSKGPAAKDSVWVGKQLARTKTLVSQLEDQLQAVLAEEAAAEARLAKKADELAARLAKLHGKLSTATTTTSTAPSGATTPTTSSSATTTPSGSTTKSNP